MEVESLSEAGVNREDIGVSTLLQLLGKGASACPDKLAVVTPEGSITYAQAYELAISLARYYIYGLGLGPKDTMLVYLSNCCELPSLIAAGEAVGLRIVLRPPSVAESSVWSDATLAGASLIVLKQGRRCPPREGEFRAVPVLRAGTKADPSSLRGVAGRAICGDITHRLYPEKSQLVLFTSGTTGEPKGIVHSPRSFAYNAQLLTEALGFGSDEVLLAPVPIFHVYGLVSMFAALRRCSTWAVVESFSASGFQEFAERVRPTIYFCVPTMLIRGMLADDSRSKKFSRLRVCMVAGDMCPGDVLEKFEKRYGCKMVLSYGMTETAATLTVEDPCTDEGIRRKSVGRPIGGVTMAIEKGTGEILVQTPSVMVGSLDRGGFTPFEPDGGWLRTGDVGSIDADGRLMVLSRMKNVIIRGGASVYPSQVERTYRQHPAVEDCAVVGIPDGVLGQKVCLCVVGKPRCQETLDGFREFGKTRLEKGMLPDKVVFLDNIPITQGGKRDDAALAEMAAKS